MVDTITIKAPKDKLTLLDVYKYNLYCGEEGFYIGVFNGNVCDSESDGEVTPCANFKEFLNNYYPDYKKNATLKKVFGHTNFECGQFNSLEDFNNYFDIDEDDNKTLDNSNKIKSKEELEDNYNKSRETFSFNDCIERLQKIINSKRQ